MTALFETSSWAIGRRDRRRTLVVLSMNLSLNGSLPNCDFPEFAWLTGVLDRVLLFRPSCAVPSRKRAFVRDIESGLGCSGLGDGRVLGVRKRRSAETGEHECSRHERHTGLHEQLPHEDSSYWYALREHQLRPPYLSAGQWRNLTWSAANGPERVG